MNAHSASLFLYLVSFLAYHRAILTLYVLNIQLVEEMSFRLRLLVFATLML